MLEAGLVVDSNSNWKDCDISPSDIIINSNNTVSTLFHENS